MMRKRWCVDEEETKDPDVENYTKDRDASGPES